MLFPEVKSFVMTKGNLLKKDTTEKLYLCIIELDPKKQSVFNTEKFKNWISTLYDKKTIKFIIQ